MSDFCSRKPKTSIAQYFCELFYLSFGKIYWFHIHTQLKRAVELLYMIRPCTVNYILCYLCNQDLKGGKPSPTLQSLRLFRLPLLRGLRPRNAPMEGKKSQSNFFNLPSSTAAFPYIMGPLYRSPLWHTFCLCAGERRAKSAPTLRAGAFSIPLPGSLPAPSAAKSAVIP